jgi:hypothetical protein
MHEKNPVFRGAWSARRFRPRETAKQAPHASDCQARGADAMGQGEAEGDAMSDLMTIFSEAAEFSEQWEAACGDYPALRAFAAIEARPPAEAPKPKLRQRKTSVGKLIAQAEKSGKPVTSITTADGTTLHFGEPEPTVATNPWLADLNKEKQQ